jgi:hypothetical protein
MISPGEGTLTKYKFNVGARDIHTKYIIFRLGPTCEWFLVFLDASCMALSKLLTDSWQNDIALSRQFAFYVEAKSHII